MKKKQITKWIGILSLFIFSFLIGKGIAHVEHNFCTPDAVETSASGEWGLNFQEEGKPPIADYSAEELAKYDAYYARQTKEKVIYLTFDAGYENGNTPAILDALKKHHAPATFFVVGNYLESNPDLVKRMVKEGHFIGNHTEHHPDMSTKETKEEFSKELISVEEKCKKISGKQIANFYRPPQGKFSTKNLEMAKDMGYKTIFWSLAYVDWDVDNQPSHEEAIRKLTGRLHPGAIVLLHNTSKTNGEILDELLTKWEEMGYRFDSLDHINS